MGVDAGENNGYYSAMTPALYLASTSPRRRELLAQIGVSFQPLTVDVPETLRPNEVPELFVSRLALAKARAGLDQLGPGDNTPVLGADTVVVIEGEVLGKPRDRADALAMFARLSGQTHHVMSGVAVVNAEGEASSRLSVSSVTFRPVSEAERARYWDSGESADKAGGYGIQGLGAIFVERLEGSYSGVMGLPLFETAELLGQFGIDCLARPAEFQENNKETP